MLLTNDTPLLNVNLTISDLLLFDVDLSFKEEHLSIDERLFFVKVVRALAEDILSISDDFETTISFFFQKSKVLIEMERSYPFLLCSSFNFDLSNQLVDHQTMFNYINANIEKGFRTKDSYFNIVDFRPFFENIRYVDRILDMDGTIFSFYKDISFIRGDECIAFQSFQSFKNFNADVDYPILKIIFGELSVTISPVDMIFTVLNGMTTMSFLNRIKGFNTKSIDDMSKMIIDMYNMETTSHVDTMKNLMLMVRMKAI